MSVLGLSWILAFGAAMEQAAGGAATRPSDLPRVALEIACEGESWGSVVIELEERKAPVTVRNFLRYVDEGYYDGTIIHRVVTGPRIHVIQGGGYTGLNQPSKPGQHEPIKLESENGLSNVRGTIAMARDASPDTATSEYFINTEDNLKLDYSSREKPGYAVFGRVVEGMGVIDRVRRIETRENPDPELKGEKSQPVAAPVVVKARRVGATSAPAGRDGGGRP